MARERREPPAWVGLTGGMFNLVGLLFLMARLAAGLGIWALAVGVVSITIGAAFTWIHVGIARGFIGKSTD